jgi:hypothetical protein
MRQAVQRQREEPKWKEREVMAQSQRTASVRREIVGAAEGQNKRLTVVSAAWFGEVERIFPFRPSMV